MQVRVLPDAPTLSAVKSISSTSGHRRQKTDAKHAWPILGQFLGPASARAAWRALGQDERESYFSRPAVKKIAAGFPRSSSGESRFAESERGEGQEASGALFGERVGELFLRKPPTQLHYFLRRESGIRELLSRS